MKIKLAAAVALIALTAGCASEQMGNVIPKPNNRYDVVGKGASEDDAMQMSLKTAEATCKSRNMRHVVLGHQTKYKGLVSEQTNKVINTGASIIAALSTKAVPTLSDEDDYQVTMEFSCEA